MSETTSGRWGDVFSCPPWRSTVGVIIMLGTLFGLIALVYALVLRFDPEARRSTPVTADD